MNICERVNNVKIQNISSINCNILKNMPARAFGQKSGQKFENSLKTYPWICLIIVLWFLNIFKPFNATAKVNKQIILTHSGIHKSFSSSVRRINCFTMF